MVPPQDSPRQNARWERSYDDHYNGGDQYGDGGRAFDHPRAAMHDRPAETYAEPTGEWHSGASEPAATGRAYPPQDDSYHYPETTRDSWRDERGWDAAPNEYSPHRDSTGVVPRWEQGSRSASRSGQPGVARLHGDIEQPPLRRADERDRPSVY